MTAYGGPLLFLIGAPGSGKSTWARRHFPRKAIVSLDGCRELVSGDAGNQAATEAAVTVRDAIVMGRLRFGRPTVVDATNTQHEHRAGLASSGYGHGCPPIAVLFDTPLDVCIERNAVRPRARRVPEEFVMESWRCVQDELATMRPPQGFHLAVHVVHDDGTYVEGFVAREYREQTWLAAARDEVFDPRFSNFRSRGYRARTTSGSKP